MDTSPLKSIDKIMVAIAVLWAAPTTAWALYTLASGFAGS